MDAQDVAAELIESLTSEEDLFCLSITEYNGNLGLAYTAVWPEAKSPLARAKQLFTQPRIQARLAQLAGAVQEHHLCSIESHMTELAIIRDMSKAMGNMKTAFSAEQARGTVAGFYRSKGENASVVVDNSHLEKLASRLTKMLPPPAFTEAIVVNGQS
jgi:hypothetical protein